MESQKQAQNLAQAEKKNKELLESIAAQQQAIQELNDLITKKNQQIASSTAAQNKLSQENR